MPPNTPGHWLLTYRMYFMYFFYYWNHIIKKCVYITITCGKKYIKYIQFTQTALALGSGPCTFFRKSAFPFQKVHFYFKKYIKFTKVHLKENKTGFYDRLPVLILLLKTFCSKPIYGSSKKSAFGYSTFIIETPARKGNN